MYLTGNRARHLRAGSLPALLALLCGCATWQLQPVPDRLQPWTTTLRDQQPGEAYAAVYRIGRKWLVFLAADHANRDDSPTFRLIRGAFAAFAIDTVIAEGFPTSRGANPARLFQYASENGPRSDGFVEGGETVPTVLGARREGATLWGGDADDVDVKARILAEDFLPEDLLGFYVLRNIPQWIGERRIENAGDPRLQALVAAALDRNRAALQLPPDILPNFAEWASWYQARNHKPLGADFMTEEVGPLADGRFGTNRIAFAISRARDAYLHSLVIAHLNARESVLVVFGGSHLMIHRPALDVVLGAPCYVGTDMERAARACR
jgi:hypothetical protein